MLQLSLVVGGSQYFGENIFGIFLIFGVISLDFGEFFQDFFFGYFGFSDFWTFEIFRGIFLELCIIISVRLSVYFSILIFI